MIIWLITAYNEWRRGISDTNFFLGFALGMAEFVWETVFVLAFLAKI